MRAAFAASSLALAASFAQAEPAFVRSGTSLGQGWVFSFRGDCWLATPRHVVRPDAGVIVIGPDRMQGFDLQTNLHPTEDLALVRLGGELAVQCPNSPRGDLDSLPAIKRAFSEGQEVAFERRQFDEASGQAGIDIVPAHIIAVPEADSVFMIRPSYPDEDPVVQSDSGSPVRMRGSGIGGSGYPLGIVVRVTDTGTTQYVEALKMDRIRSYVEEVTRAGVQEASADNIEFQITGFSGTTAETACGPSNVGADAATCGWRVERSADRTYPSITVKLSSKRDVGSVSMTFRGGEEMKGLSVSSKLSDGSWTTTRYCSSKRSPAVCRVPIVSSDELRIVIDAQRIEVVSVKVE